MWLLRPLECVSACVCYWALHVCTHVHVTCAFTHACTHTVNFALRSFTISGQAFMRVCVSVCLPYCTAACMTPRLRSAPVQCCPRFVAAKLKLFCLPWHAARCGVFQLVGRWNWSSLCPWDDIVSLSLEKCHLSAETALVLKKLSI